MRLPQLGGSPRVSVTKEIDLRSDPESCEFLGSGNVAARRPCCQALPSVSYCERAFAGGIDVKATP